MKPARLVLLSDTLLALYTQMLRIRRCEERLVKSFYEGFIPGRFYSSEGQEASAVGVCYHLTQQDVVFSTHRGQGHALAKGMPMVKLFAELYGRVAGCAGGRGGPSFLFDPQHGLLGTSGIAGASILQAVGAAHAFQMQGLPHVAVAFFGDGAANCGAFHEGLNLAAVWCLPVVFVCENNACATPSPPARGSASMSISSRAKSYDIPGLDVEGKDVSSVYAAAFEGVRRAREGKGPTLIECRTVRRRPACENDPYLLPPSSEQTSEMEKNDPLRTLARRLTDSEAATAQELKELDERIVAEVEEAHRQALDSPWPDPAQVWPSSEEAPHA